MAERLTGSAFCRLYRRRAVVAARWRGDRRAARTRLRGRRRDEWNAATATRPRLDLRESQSARRARAPARERVEARVSATGVRPGTIRVDGVQSVFSPADGRP